MSRADCASKIKLDGIRIARVSTVPFFVVTQLKQQLAMLGEAGADVLVITSPSDELSVLGKMRGVRCKPIEIPRAIAPVRDSIALFRLFRLFKKEHTQIAHSTTPKAGLLTALAAFLAGVPIRLHTFTGQPWVNMHGIKAWLTRSSDRLIAKLNTHCYADSASQKDFLIAQGIIDSEKITVIAQGSLAGVDTQRFQREKFSSAQNVALRHKLGIPVDAPVILFLGRITIDKGVRELLQAFTEIKALGNSAHLLLVGPLDVASGVAGAIELSDIERIADTHWVDYTDLPEAYIAIADMLCLPSYREGFGTVVIEAGAMGVPTVGTEIYGLTDAIVKGETGLLVAPKNTEALTAALLTLLDNPAQCQNMGQAALHRARTMFDAQIVNQQVIAEYQAVLQRHGINADE
ncbi:MAG: glycosyltransferase [Sideroxydans sp.]|nr:glycosyltransferase [Sideroxydans sp.]